MAQGTQHRLSPAFVRKCKTPGVYLDGGGLRFRVTNQGSRIWVMRFSLDGAQRDMSLGPVAKLSLADARDKAHAVRKAVSEGRDPLAEIRKEKATRKASRMAAAAATNTVPTVIDVRPTFEACWRSFWLVKRPQLSNGKHLLQWEMTMDTYVLPHIGQLPIEDIRPGEIIEMLRPIWHTKEETARRVLQRVEAVFISAITRELRTRASPCTGVSRELGTRRRKQAHHAALPYSEVAAFVQQLRLRKGPLTSRLAFEFLILTATRSGETRGAMWSEIDLAARTWTIEAERMKARTEHVIPLSPRAIEILKVARAAHPQGGLCFPNRDGDPLSDMVFTKTLRDMGLGERATAHGFRTSFKTWAAETGVRDEVSEAALAHTDPNEVRAAYRRTTYLEERRIVMRDWGQVVKRGT